jgi:hypothetical protein
MKTWWMKKVAKILAIAVAVVALFGAAVMMLWNVLIPDIFHGPTITYWQAIGLLILSHILVRSWGGMHNHPWKHDRWKHKLEEKLATLTPEEREKFKEEYRRRCGWVPDDKKDL